MKELIKPKKLISIQITKSFCEVDCDGCMETKCNKVCKGNPGGNISTNDNEDILF